MNKSVAFVSLSLAALVGCGGDDPKKPVIVVDAPDNNTVDAPDQQGGCTAPATIPGGMGAIPFTYTKDDLAMVQGDQESWLSFTGANQDPMPDALFIGFFEGGGDPSYTFDNFPMNVSAQQPLVVQLDGPESDATKCSVCIGLFTDVNTANMMELEYADDYMANAGTVTLTALSETKITGTIENVTMRHVDIVYPDPAQNIPGSTTNNPSGCTSTLGNISFDSVPTAAMARTADGRLMRGVRLPIKRALAAPLAQ